MIALGLTGLAWWALQDGAAGNDWLVSGIRAVTVVILSKTGLKALVVLVVLMAAGFAWLRRRRRVADGSRRGAGAHRDAEGRVR